MGYETRLYIGHVGCSGPARKVARLQEDFRCNPRGTCFHVFSENDRDFFYLLDGETKVFTDEAPVEMLPEAERPYFFNIAMIDLCKAGRLREFLDESAVICETPDLWQGNSILVEDLYGDPLVVYSAQATVIALQKAKEAADREGGYWRLDVALQLLADIICKAWQDDLGVIFYGY